MRAATGLILVMLLTAPLAAGASNIPTAAHKNTIEIGLAYKGDQIHFFGVNPTPGCKLVMKLTSLDTETLTLSLAGSLGPFWLTDRQYAVSGAPVVFEVHAQGRLADLADPEFLAALKLDADSLAAGLRPRLIRGRAAPGDETMVRQGLFRIKRQQGLYNLVEDSPRLKVKEGKLYQNYFQFPPGAVEGLYLVESFCFENRRLVGYGREEIEIRKVGLQDWLTRLARTRPLPYGLMAVGLALGLGLAVGIIFKRGRHH